MLPPLRSRVSLTLELSDRPLSCVAEIVRHVTSPQAAVWGMRAGFAVQFIELSADAREALGRVLHGQPPPPTKTPGPLPDDPSAEAMLATLQRRMSSDPYVVLSLPHDATFDDVRRQVRDIQRGLESIAARPLSVRQARELAELRARVEKAAELLGHPRQRTEHDAWRGNYVGVARCIACGLTATEIDSLRARYLLAHPGAQVRERIHTTTAAAWESQGKIDLALAEYEKALSADPLNLQVQQRYWSLKRRNPPPRRWPPRQPPPAPAAALLLGMGRGG